MKVDDLRHVFKEYDIRGKAGIELDFDFAQRLGWAFGAFLEKEGPKAVSVGRDVRLSSPELRDGLVQGLVEAGFIVYDVGVVPSPVLYYSLHKLKVAGGVMITASHNPSDENGFKIARGVHTIASEEVAELYRLFCETKYPGGTGRVEKIDVETSYRERLLSEFLHLREGLPLRVAVDAGNGVAGPLAVAVLEGVGCEVIPLYCEPDGTFPNHQPDPTVPSLMKELSETVVEKGLDIGIGIDGDGDRLGIVNEKGELLWGDRLLVLFARQVLENLPGATIVSEVKCTNYLFEDIERRGGVPVMWKAGHSLVKKKMQEVGAALGGEMSGHYFFKDRFYGFDDAIYAACRALEILSKAKNEGKTFSQLLQDMPVLYSTGEVRVPVPEELKFKLVEDMKEKLTNMKIPGFTQKEIVDIDGIRINYDRGWALLRSSNTQAMVVMRFEATTPDDLALLQSSWSSNWSIWGQTRKNQFL